MDKQTFLRENRVSEMPRLVQVLAGKLYDAAFEHGRKHGFQQGVDQCALKREEIHHAYYEQGAKDANHYGSAAFTAAACMVMRRNCRWGRKRLARLVEGIGAELVGMLDPSDTIRELRKIGIRIEYDDLLDYELGEAEEC